MEMHFKLLIISKEIKLVHLDLELERAKGM